MRPDAGQVAHAVAVGVGERPRVDLVEDGPLPPGRVGAASLAGGPDRPGGCHPAGPRFGPAGITPRPVAPPGPGWPPCWPGCALRCPGCPGPGARWPAGRAPVVLEPFHHDGPPAAGRGLQAVGPAGDGKEAEGRRPRRSRSRVRSGRWCRWWSSGAIRSGSGPGTGPRSPGPAGSPTHSTGHALGRDPAHGHRVAHQLPHPFRGRLDLMGHLDGGHRMGRYQPAGAAPGEGADPPLQFPARFVEDTP